MYIYIYIYIYMYKMTHKILKIMEQQRFINKFHVLNPETVGRRIEKHFRNVFNYVI